MVIFEPGNREKNISITILDDTVMEDVEMFIATLTTSDPNVYIPVRANTSIVVIGDTDSKCG